MLDQLEDAPDLVIDPRFDEVQTDEQIDVMMPILIERDPRFADLVARWIRTQSLFKDNRDGLQLLGKPRVRYRWHPDLGGLQWWCGQCL